MSEETEEDRLERIERLCIATHTAIVGDEALGHRGLARRVSDLEKSDKSNTHRFILWSGIATGASIIITAFKEKFFS